VWETVGVVCWHVQEEKGEVSGSLCADVNSECDPLPAAMLRHKTDGNDSIVDGASDR